MNVAPTFAPNREEYTCLLVTKLRGFDAVSDAEADILERAVKGTRDFGAGRDIVGLDEKPGVSSLLIEGWAARSKTFGDATDGVSSAR